MTKKKTAILVSVAFAIIAIVIIALSSGKTTEDVHIVQKGKLTSSISCVGEVKGAKATSINLPEELQNDNLRMWEIKIVDVIQEGKSVKKGEYVAKLDESVLRNNMRTRLQEKEKTDADLKHAILDSTVRLTGMREDITNLLMDLEYNKIDLELSVYESAADQRKTKMAYQKAEIALEKKRRDYKLQQNKSKVNIRRQEQRVEYLQKYLDSYQKAIRATRLVSPGNGLIMFEKDHSGKKYTKDSRIYTFMNSPIASLPDMSTVVSEAYVKEIDVTKIHVNDSVSISIDALSEKEFTGRVVKIANIGEEHKNFDMKVFKVKVQFDFSDSELKPGMTCNNEIIIENYEEALLVPLEAIFSSNNKSYVFKKDGRKIIKQFVAVGGEDELNVVILDGLSEGDEILLKEPEDELMAEI